MSSLRPQPEILWDVVKEHLDEAGWLWEQRDRTLLALDHTLADVEEGDEGRMLAHLDGLVVGGAEVAEELLLPALEGEEPREATAAAWALLAAEDRDWTKQVLDALVSGKPELRPAIRAALSLSARPGLDDEIAKRFPGAEPDVQRELLEALTARGSPTGALLERLRPERDPLLLAAAVRAARFAPPAVADPYLQVALRESSPAVREAGLETGIALGRRDAWEAARAAIEAGNPSRAALLIVAMGGTPEDVELLMRVAQTDVWRDEALWAAGFSGRRSAVEGALTALLNGAGRVAAETFLLITGCPLGPDVIHEKGEEEEEELSDAAEPGGKPEPVPSCLPGPAWPQAEVEEDALERWWADHGAPFDAAGRYGKGKPFSLDLLLRALEGAPTRYRPVLSLELSARSRGAHFVNVTALCAAQRAQIARARTLQPSVALRPFSELLRR